jgi:hypothetical protein
MLRKLGILEHHPLHNPKN